MSNSMTDKKLIGRVEPVSFPELGLNTVHARIDTGAQTSALWASKVNVVNDRLEVIFFGPEHAAYDGKIHYFDTFTHGMVASSNGQIQHRYKIQLLIKIAGKRIRATVSLADRSTQVYPMLIGRNVLRGKFVVDVKAGKPLIAVEKLRSEKLQSQNPGDQL